MKNNFYISLLALLSLVSCSTVKPINTAGDDGNISINFIQINDVYEIAPLNRGTEGGIARVATVKKKYLDKNPNTYLLIAGDFLSPSVYNSLKYEGKSVRGKQMVESLNAAGMDFAVFGNHEFDIKEAELQERINESRFQWISSNTFHKINGSIVPFTKTSESVTTALPVTFIKTVKDADGTVARIGFIGLTLPFNKASYVNYADVLTTAKKLYNQLKDSTDAVIAITHQSMEEDIELAKQVPGLAMILGGHEHDQRYAKVGNVEITKALANAKSAYIIRLSINKNTHKIKVHSKLEYIDETVVLDSATNSVVQRWMDIAVKSYSSLGFDAGKIIVSAGEPLNGIETAVRSQSTNLTKLIVNAMLFAAPQADVAILNAGSIRVDDVLQIPVTQYDILRTLPFGGSIREADMKGSLLIKILEAGFKNKGIGGYLHYNETLKWNAENKWELKGQELDPAKTYRVALPDFMLTGGETNLDFLTPKNKEIIKLYEEETSGTDPRSDIRKAVIRFIEKG